MSIVPLSIRPSQALDSRPVEDHDDDGALRAAVERAIETADDEIAAREEGRHAFKSAGEAVEKSLESAQADQAEWDAWERSREVRDKLRAEAGDGFDIGQVLAHIVGVWDRSGSDPAGEASRLQTYYLRQYHSPAFDDAARRRQDATKLPDHADDTPMALDRAISAALDARTVRERDEAEFAATREARAAFAEKFPGAAFDAVMAQFYGLHQDFRANPVEATARFAAFRGFPVTAERAQELTAIAAQDHAQASAADHLLEQLQNGAMPLFPQLMDTMAELIDQPEFPRSGDPATDFNCAYQLALAAVTQEANAARVAKAQAAAGPAKGTGPDLGPMSAGGRDDALSRAIEAALSRGSAA